MKREMYAYLHTSILVPKFLKRRNTLIYFFLFFLNLNSRHGSHVTSIDTPLVHFSPHSQSVHLHAVLEQLVMLTLIFSVLVPFAAAAP